MDLHNKEGLKEQLTDHLYTIIHQNEVRKAKKLSELLHKLNMATPDSEEILNSAVMDVPAAMTMFSPVHVVKRDRASSVESDGKQVAPSVESDGKQTAPSGESPSQTAVQTPPGESTENKTVAQETQSTNQDSESSQAKKADESESKDKVETKIGDTTKPESTAKDTQSDTPAVS